MGIKHFYQPTPAKWRKIGDTILLGCTSLSSMVMGLPLSEHQQLWTIFVLNGIGVIGKMLTNFFKEDEPQPPGV
jgi:hypothetical protein